MKTNWFKGIAAAVIAAFTFTFAPSAWAEPECVQLWEDGPYFATCNVGAENPEDCGYYFWWGDTVGYTNNLAAKETSQKWYSVADGKTMMSFTESNATASSTAGKTLAQLKSLGYIDDESDPHLNAAHDAATVHWGSSWRMPTEGEFKKLVDTTVCTSVWTTVNGVYGRKVFGVTDGYKDKSIFFPAAGIGHGGKIRTLGVDVYNLSSTPNLTDTGDACALYGASSAFKCSSTVSRSSGRPIRAVCDTPPVTAISFTIDTESGVTAEWSTDGETWTAYDPETAKAPEGDLYIRLTKADGGVKVVTQTLNDDSKAFDLSSEIFGWAEYLGEALDGEFIIDDLAEFKKFVSKWQALGTEGITFKLGADITLDAITTIGAINAKDRIGSDTYIAEAFRGTFDGDNYTISNVILPCGDYVGFFGSTYGATIRNLKLSFGKEGCYDTDNLVANYCGATFVGVSLKTTIENCETIRTATVTNVFLEKAAGGIVGFASGGTVLKNCVNNLDVVSKKNEKAGGLIAISQDAGVTETTGYGVTIDGCTNNGNVESKALNKTRVGGLLTYTDNTVTFKGLNTFTGTLTQNGGTAVQSIININNGSVVLAEDASFRVPAAYKTVNDGKAVDGLFFATVEDGVATLVKNEAAVNGADLKVMASGAPAIELNAVGDSITLDTSLAQATVTTDVDNAEILQEGNTYTVQAKVVAVESVTLDQATAELTVGGEDLTLTATVNPENATDKTVTWTSSDETVATVSGGVVTAVGVGETTITAKAGDKSATCTVTVKEPEPTTVAFTLEWDDNVSAVSYTIGGETTEIADLSTGSLTIDVEADTVVTVGASAKDWYNVATGAGDVTVDAEKTVEIATELVKSLADVGIENFGDVSVADAKEWADAKEITPAQIAACDFAYDAYLMNTDLSAKPELTIVGIAEVDGGWAITVKGTAGESDIDLGNINGMLKVKTSAKLEDLEAADAIAYDIDVRAEDAVIKIAGENKNFMRAVVTK